MKIRSLIFWFATASGLVANPDLFQERFADPETRALALESLIPGTRGHYFHTALDHQLAGRTAEFQQTLAAWKNAASTPDRRLSTAGLSTLENRQLLLQYPTAPEATAAELIRCLDLKFDATLLNDAENPTPRPSRLDPSTISEVTFEATATRIQPDAPYHTWRGPRILRELDNLDSFDAAKTRWFLNNLPRADHPNTAALVLKGLTQNDPIHFGSTTTHQNLTAAQLAFLLENHESLRSDPAAQLAYLGKSLPGSETDFAHDLPTQAAHLAFCRNHALTLPPALVSLKAHILHHHLRLQAELGNHPLDDLLTYLALPRVRHSILRVPENAATFSIDPDANFLAATGCPPIGDDSALIETLLSHHLAAVDEPPAALIPLIPANKLARLHARARLLAGAPPDRWAAALNAPEYQSLQEASHIRFAPGRPFVLPENSDVALTLDLKNTPELLIRIHELDVPTHVARHRSQPDVHTDLDGLVPHQERRLTFADKSPLVQHRQTIPLPELSGPGAWIVDIVSGAVSARALIRKGDLTTHLRRTPDGQAIHVFDAAGQPVANATLTLGSATFAANSAGIIRIPNRPAPIATRGIVRTGKLATPVTLGNYDDALALDLRAHLDREQILADIETALLVRPHLTNHGHSISLDRLENPTLTLKASLLGGITVERVIAENLVLAPTFEVPFQVPADVIELTLTLRATVTPAGVADPVRLEATTTWRPNAGLTGDTIEEARFSPTPAGHLLEIRGRNGEPFPDRRVTLEFHRPEYTFPVRTELFTDANGRIQLGDLDGIHSVVATNHASATYHPAPRTIVPTNAIHQPAGSDIRVPLVAPTAGRHHVSLLEMRSNSPARDHFGKIAVEGPFLVIRGLPPGSHLLTQGDHTTHIEISSGTRHGDLLVSPVRILPHLAPAQPVITSAAVDGDHLVIRLNGHGPDTRISLVGRQFAHATWRPGNAMLPFPPQLPDVLPRKFLGCDYLIDRRLSDEMRYIHARRSATVFPGNMLPRPGTLLNRWNDQEIDFLPASGGHGSIGRRDLGGLPGTMGRLGGIPSDKPSADSASSILDFLASPAITRFLLEIPTDGTLRLPLADFANCRLVEITAADAFARDTRTLALPAADLPLRDRRLARSLDPATPHVATRGAIVLAKDGTATIENLLDADWRAFATLADAHQLLYGLLPDNRLRDFIFLTEWPAIPEARKLDLLRQHACHEFHLFLQRRDRPFFDAHVRPLLIEKPEPTFLDDYLLGRDLTPYLRHFAWNKLNAVEKALLAQALPDARPHITTELNQRWALESPSPESLTRLFTRTLRGADLATEDTLSLARNDLHNSIDSETAGANEFIQEKLRRIIIPKINFPADTTIEEAVAFLRQRVRELDVLELNPEHKGISFHIRRPQTESLLPPLDDLGVLPGNPKPIRVGEMNLQNIPVATALQYICDAANLRYQVTPYGIQLGPITDSGDPVTTRTFTVPPGFLASLSQGSGGGADVDPFAAPADTRPGSPPDILEALQNAGINFGAGAKATLTPNGNLVVTNTPDELTKVEGLTTMLLASAGGQAPGFTSGGDHGLGLDSHDPFGAVDPFAAPEAPFQALQPPTGDTRRWHESNYHRHAGPSDESLIPLNRFWIDLAAWDGQGSFLSPHFNACHNSHNEALMCLALLDLPFTAPRPEANVEGDSLRVQAREPAILFFRDIRRAEEAAADTPLLVRQSFLPARQPFIENDGLQIENTVTGDFRPGSTYLASLIVTNPTGSPRRIDLLAQIPAGAIPLEGHTATHSSSHILEAHGIVRRELVFYFPAPGEFSIHPFTVSAEGTVLARTAPRQLRVALSGPDSLDDLEDSWDAVTLDGTKADILAYLRTANLHTLDFDYITHLLPDREFFLQVTALLRQRLRHEPHIFKWGFHHNDPAAMRDYLENSAASRQLGTWLDSELLEIRPRIHHDWESLEFDPLINPRVHPFGDHPRLSHPEARDHYRDFLDVLAWKPALDAADHLTLAAFLFLQDRTAEALERFAKIDPAKLPSRLHYDYLHAVALFHQEKTEAAAEIAARRLPTLPPGLWRDRFQAVATQAAEIAALNSPGQPVENDTPPPATAPTLEIARGDAGKLILKHHNLENAALRVFSVDLEVLFSKDPFLAGGTATHAEPAILPNHTLDVPLEADVAETTLQLPEPLRRGNLLVSATAGDARLLRILDSDALDMRLNTTARTLRVTATATSRPLPKTYVKIYIEDADGNVHFHKDGHTDLRGLFDPITHPSRPLTDIHRLAILAHHPDHGTTTRILTP